MKKIHTDAGGSNPNKGPDPIEHEPRWMRFSGSQKLLVLAAVPALLALAVVGTRVIEGDQLIGSGSSASPGASDPARSIAEAAVESREFPNQWFFDQRAFPQGRIPIESWRMAQNQAAAHRAAESVQGNAWTARGPVNIGGRITDLAVDSNDANIVFAGSAEGGVLRSLNGGQNWTPVFDEMPALAIGAVAIDPSDSNVIYAGTGEVNPGGGSVAYGGAGIFKSTDQGETWALLGLDNSGSIGRIRVSPIDPLTIFVAAAGTLWEQNTTRGVYRTTNGGTTWQNVLFVNSQTGCVDLIQDPSDPNVLFASMWQRIRQPEYYDYGGVSCAVHKTTDGGDSWNVVAGGLPTPSIDGGRIGLSLSKSQPNVVHAVYADRTGGFDGLYRSTNSGTSWVRTNDGALVNVFATFGWWFGNVRTHPVDSNSIYVLGLELWRSTDAGASFFDATGDMHVDFHGLDFGPGATPVLYSGNDGGIYRSTDAGGVWAKLPDMPITQVYRIAKDPNNTAALFIGAQDNGTCRTLTGADDDWENVFGGDGFQTLIDPLDSNSIWAQYQYGNIFFTSNGGSNWLRATFGVPGTDRVNWNAPHIQDPSNLSTRYRGSNLVYRNTNDRNWVAISPDLTGGAHQDNPGQVDGSLTTLAVSALDSAVIWAGSNDGHVNVTVNDGVTWTDVSAPLPERWVTAVRCDPVDRETAYVTISGYRWTEPLAHVYRTTDLGANWVPIAGDLPEVPINDFVVDPTEPGRYFVATDLGVYQSLDLGVSWTMFGADLPNVVTTSMMLDAPNKELFVGTFGRGVFSRSTDLTLVFADGFDRGDTSLWSAVVP